MTLTQRAAFAASASLALCLAAIPNVQAEAEQQPQQPQSTQQQDAPDPDITTHQDNGREVKEYRVNGKLYAIRIKPAHAPAYYLVDTDGDGNFQRQNDDQRVVVPRWTIASW
ncbi:hypothetical protein R84981_002500 [Carnimonas sp. R-84981]|uniref:DUF2782 domain-containing protein n=1 Tax=Carnimonas bestiolae TaxID=3402172 RepID=UPI003EDC08EF